MPVIVPAMGGDNNGIGAAEARSALDWWLTAGVDVAVQESPRNWLAPAPPAPAAEAPGPVAEEPLPATLDLFRDWLASSPSVPLAASATKRVLPLGAEEAELMLLVDAPSAEDAADGRPIGGEAWALTQRMLAAIGLSAGDAYVASLTCAYAPGAQLSGAEREACAELARRHVALARPRRLLLLGEGPARALLGKTMVQARGHVQKVEGVRTVVTFPPRHLMKRPSDKALAWKDLLLLMEEPA